MMRLVRMNEQNAVAVTRKLLAAYPSLKKAENLETGPLSDGLTVEPREDAI